MITLQAEEGGKRDAPNKEKTCGRGGLKAGMESEKERDKGRGRKSRLIWEAAAAKGERITAGLQRATG